MAVGWLELPAEVRNMIYRELFRSSPIVLHQNLETWDCSDVGSEDGFDEASVDGKGADNATGEVNKEACLAILRTSWTVRREAEFEFYAQTPFVIEHRTAHYIERPGFEIDRRIKHLLIEQESDMDLWLGTISFLERHFCAGGVTLRELTVSNDVFDEDDDQELRKFLSIALPHVDKLSFVMAIDGGSRFDPVDNVEYLLPNRVCPVEMSRYHDTVIRSKMRSDFYQVRKRLMRTRALSSKQQTFKWLRG